MAVRGTKRVSFHRTRWRELHWAGGSYRVILMQWGRFDIERFARLFRKVSRVMAPKRLRRARDRPAVARASYRIRDPEALRLWLASRAAALVSRRQADSARPTDTKQKSHAQRFSPEHFISRRYFRAFGIALRFVALRL